MGNKQSVFDAEALDEFQECTYFNERQIIHLYKRFSALNADKINPKSADVDTRLSFSEIRNLPELKENPFKVRICEVFSSNGRGLTFKDFLDMCSVFSEGAAWDLKAAYAFRVYDFNSDAFLCKNDLEETLICITGDGLDGEEISVIVDHVIKEADIDEDGKLSYAEFEHIVSRAPDFINLFRMTL